MGEPYPPAQYRQQRKGIECNPAVHRETEAVDENAVDESSEFNGAGDNDVQRCDQNGSRYGQRFHDSPFGDLRIFPEIVDKDDRRDDQQVEQVYADRESREVSDQDQPAVRMRFVRDIFPLEDRPEDECRKHRREGIDFAFDCGKPESVGKRISDRTHQAGSHDSCDLRQG